LATGDVIGLLNSDDMYSDENVLTDVMKYFNDDPDLNIVYGNLIYVKNNDTDKIIRKWISKPYYNNFFEHGNIPPHPALFLRSSVYKKAGLFDLRYKLAADYEFMFRVFKKHTFKSKYINRLTVKMRLGGATNKSFKNILNGNKEILKAWKNNGFTPPITLMLQRIIKRLVQFI
jgi:glycosyltransferase